MTKTVRQKLVRFSIETDGGTKKWNAEDEAGIWHLTHVENIDLEAWLEKQRTSGNFAEGQKLVDVVKKYQTLEAENGDHSRGRRA